MKTLSSALLSELALTVTRPGYLVQINYSTTLYLSTMGDISWDGHTWAGADIQIAGIGQDGSANANGALRLGNTDNAYSSIVLNEGASDIAVQIWVCYAGATASGDPVKVFEGVTDGSDISHSKVSLKLLAQANGTLYSPRTFINKTSGFNFLQPVGTKIYFGGETFILQRD